MTAARRLAAILAADVGVRERAGPRGAYPQTAACSNDISALSNACYASNLDAQ